ncbi:MAG TPA: Maf family nucleotide pyrophosphatase [Gaiellaceae bacterium]|nr:Maf family nucleotide pyrophosphatase [Gaiellaceae bacterium]
MSESIVLASSSPQRSAILTQLAIPFQVVVPVYEEAPGGDPLEHAAGKARSVEGGDRPVLGVDTIVRCEGQVIGKPTDAGDAERMLELLAGRTHEVVSGLCLRTPAWEELHTDTTRVFFRELTPRDLGRYLASGEWEGRAGAYAIQGLGGSLVERIEGDYLNVVGLPGGLLVRLLATRFPGAYGFGYTASSATSANTITAPAPRAVPSGYPPGEQGCDHDRRGAHREHRSRSPAPELEQPEHERGEHGRGGRKRERPDRTPDRREPDHRRIDEARPEQEEQVVAERPGPLDPRAVDERIGGARRGRGQDDEKRPCVRLTLWAAQEHDTPAATSTTPSVLVSDAPWPGRTTRPRA